MTWRRLGLSAFLTASLALPASAAQDSSPAQDAVNVDKLPVNLERIRRQLRQASVREERDGLNLRYVVDVYGQAPKVELFTRQENMFTSPAPYGAPTHRQMIEAMTPQEFRAPAADFGALFRWLADKSRK